MRRAAAVERVNRPTLAEFVERWEKPQRPVIVAGAFEDWPARAWTVASLKEKVGSAPVVARRSASRLHPDFSSRDDAILEMTYGAFLDLVGSGPPEDRSRYFLTGDQIQFNGAHPNEGLAPLMADFRLPPYFEAERVDRCSFWTSGRGVISTLHFDANGCHNLNAQVLGSKVVKLVDPKDSASMRPRLFSALESGNFCDLPADDLDAPISDAPYLEGEIGPGDLLFIPSLWYHSFTHQGDVNVNVNFWFDPRELTLNPVTLRLLFLAHAVRVLGDGQDRTPGEFLASEPLIPPPVVDFIQKIEADIANRAVPNRFRS